MKNSILAGMLQTFFSFRIGKDHGMMMVDGYLIDEKVALLEGDLTSFEVVPVGFFWLKFF